MYDNPHIEERPTDVILHVEHLKMYFKINTGWFRSKPLKAVDDVTFDIHRGETLGLVGESGCGKTTLGRTILHLYKPTSGTIVFNGEEILGKESLRHFRQRSQIVFQDPYSSLDPRMTVEDIIAEPMDIHKSYKNKEERHARVLELMRMVGMSPEQATRYAHEFSGGQRQRIGIARALALNPEFVVCDEPVSALDVSIQAQVINKFAELQEKLGLTYIFVTHNLLVVKHIADRIAVMYLGHIVELAETEELFEHTMHPYTLSLLSAIPVPDPDIAKTHKRIIPEGDIPSPLNAPSGCPFRTRCPKATAECAKTLPPLKELKPGHFVACYHPETNKSGIALLTALGGKKHAKK
ncbi:MAG: ATP-binding cassette domain-containing protein [Bacilli bacterium]|nr:ATP-binding cassette domain-containing protein [Bacilli bacterium]